jgi:hypothetical protein
MSLEGIDSLEKLFVYQGFSAETVLKHFADIMKEKNIDQSVFQSDLKNLLVMSIMLGNVVDPNNVRVSPEGKVRIREIMEKYKISYGSVSKDNNAVSLPRIMATFPIQASRVQMNLSTVKDFGFSLGTADLPKCMKISIFPSLIPQSIPEKMKKAILFLANAYSTELSLAIGKNKDLDEVFQNQMKFTKIGFESSHPSEKFRSLHLKTLKFNFEDMKRVYEFANKKLGMKVYPEFPAQAEWEKHDFNMEDDSADIE